MLLQYLSHEPGRLQDGRLLRGLHFAHPRSCLRGLNVLAGES